MKPPTNQNINKEHLTSPSSECGGAFLRRSVTHTRNVRPQKSVKDTRSDNTWSLLGRIVHIITIVIPSTYWLRSVWLAGCSMGVVCNWGWFWNDPTPFSSEHPRYAVVFNTTLVNTRTSDVHNRLKHSYNEFLLTIAYLGFSVNF